MYQQMSLVSSSVAFSWSKWNADVSEPKKEKIIIQTAEHLVDEPLMEVGFVDIVVVDEVVVQKYFNHS